MPTYRLTARNQFRSPSGAVGEAPDGPGGMATMLDDVDNYLGVGGAEYVANAAALAAIPSSRRFLGKLAYQADNATTWRYVGTGNTNLGGNDTTHPWQAWQRPGKPWSPVFLGGYTGSATIIGWSQILDGRLFLDLSLAAGSGFALTNAEMAVNLGSAEVAIGQYTNGSGYYQPAGNSGSGAITDLAFFTAGAAVGAIATAARIRVKRIAASTVPARVTFVWPFADLGAGTATDFLAVSLSSPSALVA